MWLIPMFAFLLIASTSCSSYELVPAHEITDPGTGTFPVNEGHNRVR